MIKYDDRRATKILAASRCQHFGVFCLNFKVNYHIVQVRVGCVFFRAAPSRSQLATQGARRVPLSRTNSLAIAHKVRKSLPEPRPLSSLLWITGTGYVIIHVDLFY